MLLNSKTPSEIYDLAQIDSKIIESLKNRVKENNQKENKTDNELFLANKFEEEVNSLSSNR